MSDRGQKQYLQIQRCILQGPQQRSFFCGAYMVEKRSENKKYWDQRF
jgi:hypothetical protein